MHNTHAIRTIGRQESPGQKEQEINIDITFVNFVDYNVCPIIKANYKPRQKNLQARANMHKDF